MKGCMPTPQQEARAQAVLERADELYEILCHRDWQKTLYLDTMMGVDLTNAPGRLRPSRGCGRPVSKLGKRASYRDAVDFIAQNDDAEELDPESVTGSLTVVLVASIFGTDAEHVARDVVRLRKQLM